MQLEFSMNMKQNRGRWIMKKYCPGSNCKHADENGMIDTEFFDKSITAHDGLQGICRDCKKAHNDNHERDEETGMRKMDWLTKRTKELGGDIKDRKSLAWKNLYHDAKKDWVNRKSIVWLSTIFPKQSKIEPSKREFELYIPMTSYINTERTGEDVPDGPVYVVHNPLTPDIQKVGKTFPNGMSAILSAARRFGPAILVYEQWFPFAFEAEQAVHRILAPYNLRKIRGINPETGQYDCGKELFQCSVETVLKAIEEVSIEFRKEQAVG